MSLVTANQFRLNPDAAGAIDQGFSSGQKLRSQFQLGKRQEKAAVTEEEKNRYISVVQGASNIQNLPDDASKVGALEKRRADLIQKGLPTQDTDEVLGLFQNGRGEEANALIDGVVNAGIQQGILKSPVAAKGFTLGQGQKRFDSAGNVIAEGGEKPPALTSLQKNAAALGLAPGSPEYNDFITKGATRPGTVISKGDTAEEVALAKLGVKRFSDVQQAADGATKLLENLDQLASIDVESGALEPAKASLAAIIEGFGIDASGIANATNAQAFNAVSGRLVNEVLNAATGPQTDQDATRARKTIASLGDTPGALVFKNASLRAVALRQIDQRDFINERLDSGDTLRQANKEWRTFKKKTPSLSSVVKKDGLPMFFYQFKETSKQRRPGITDEEIITIWRGAHAKK